jgi:hypothetical protein
MLLKHQGRGHLRKKYLACQMEEYNKDTNCNPRIHIHDGDDTGVTIRIIKLIVEHLVVMCI